MRKTLFLIITTALALTSCIKDESEVPYIECDIETFTIKFNNEETKGIIGQETIKVGSTDTSIVYTATADAEIGSYRVEYTTTPGAKVFLIREDGEIPFISGSTLDFSNEKIYRIKVVSESGTWQKVYTIQIQKRKDIDTPETFEIKYAFNSGSYELLFPDRSANRGNYYIWNCDSEEDPELAASLFKVDDHTWKNGNAGFKLANASKGASAYPTTVEPNGGPDGTDCIKLTTLFAGTMGERVGCPNASGSLFNGVFDAQKAMSSSEAALTATQFGLPFFGVPCVLEADLKLEVEGIAKNGQDVEFLDEPDFYCVIYDNLDGTLTLDGNDVLSNPNIKGIARLPHLYDGIKDQITKNPIHGLNGENLGKWVHVKLDVDYNPFDKSSIDNTLATRYKQIDKEKLQNYGYSVVIGTSSSWQGARFHAFVGQTLYIDNIKLTCENPNAKE